MANISLYTQIWLLCFYSSFTFVYQSHVFRMVTSVPCQETNRLYCFTWLATKVIFSWCLSKIENWSGGGLGCVVPLASFLFFILCITVAVERLLQLWGTNFWVFFLSFCSRTPVRCWKICVYVSVQFHLNNWLWYMIKICTVEHKVEVWAKRGAGFVFHSALGLEFCQKTDMPTANKCYEKELTPAYSS